mmetsp:Transcript_24999/g.54156  ORF Transcript_24999/g.54156 Transcript_24999/m.54156 type:complete len:201 (+) Transcript_24999:138-740(+)
MALTVREKVPTSSSFFWKSVRVYTDTSTASLGRHTAWISNFSFQVGEEPLTGCVWCARPPNLTTAHASRARRKDLVLSCLASCTETLSLPCINDTSSAHTFFPDTMSRLESTTCFNCLRSTPGGRVSVSGVSYDSMACTRRYSVSAANNADSSPFTARRWRATARAAYAMTNPSSRAMASVSLSSAVSSCHVNAWRTPRL